MKKLFLFLVLSLSAFAEMRETPQKMSVSVIIPCHARHFVHIFPLLQHLQNQTSMPEEVVISLSSIQLISSAEVDSMEKYPWRFSLKILRSKEAIASGRNRNIATQASKGDIVIYQDADDIPHPQRIEIVRNLFQTRKIDHLLHGWIPESGQFVRYNPEFTPTFEFSSFLTMMQFMDANGLSVQNGHPCCTREAANALPWAEDFSDDGVGEDMRFNKTAYELFPNRIVIPEKLLLYRIGLSTHAMGVSLKE
jgi:glycosyltransferase involved in cell wall biosynthesis